MDRPFGGSAVGQVSDVGDGGFARSARTQRLEPRGRLVGGRIQDGIAGEKSLKEYRVESVGHDASPSCRDDSRQVLRVVREQSRRNSKASCRDRSARLY